MKTASLLFLLLAAGASPALSETIRVRAGLGAQLQPEFPGSDSHRITPYPSISIAGEGKTFGFGAPDDALGIKLIKAGGFSLGPSAAIASSRKDKDVGAPLGKVSTTIEVGAFAQQDIGDSLRLRGEMRKGLGGHDGIVGSVGVDHVWRDGDSYLVSVGPRLRFADSDYHRSYFGVSPAAALASGLPAYDPGGGIHAIGVTSGAHLALGGDWGLFGYARFDRLVGDAKDSPIVRRLGSPNQLSGGLGISHTFSLAN